MGRQTGTKYRTQHRQHHSQHIIETHSTARDPPRPARLPGTSMRAGTRVAIHAVTFAIATATRRWTRTAQSERFPVERRAGSLRGLLRDGLERAKRLFADGATQVHHEGPEVAVVCRVLGGLRALQRVQVRCSGGRERRRGLRVRGTHVERDGPTGDEGKRDVGALPSVRRRPIAGAPQRMVGRDTLRRGLLRRHCWAGRIRGPLP